MIVSLLCYNAKVITS